LRAEEDGGGDDEGGVRMLLDCSSAGSIKSKLIIAYICNSYDSRGCDTLVAASVSQLITTGNASCAQFMTAVKDFLSQATMAVQAWESQRAITV
jgi:hypothetical protein